MIGVKRPLRFLAERLELSDDQVKIAARVLDELKIERAQAEVDTQRSLGMIADALEAAVFDGRAALELRVQCAERLRVALTTALSELHAVLTVDQRVRFAHLVRTGAIVV